MYRYEFEDTRTTGFDRNGYEIGREAVDSAKGREPCTIGTSQITDKHNWILLFQKLHGEV